MYIALVSPYDFSRPGGVRSHILGLGTALRARGHAVEVIAPGEANAEASIPVVTCGRSHVAPFSGTQVDITWADWRRVRDVAARGYDVMHFHTIWNPAMPFQLATAFRGPKVGTFHDVAGPDTPALARAAMRPAAALLRRLWLRQVIAVSPLVASYLEPGRHHVIPNGVAAPDPLPTEGVRHAILFVGRLEPRKGVAVLLRAAALLGVDGPEVWVAGDGPLRAELMRLADRLGLARVSFLGQLSEAEKWSRLRSASVVVAPSHGGESFGIVLLEAMAAGAIPMASDIPGYRYVLNGQAATLLFPPGDAAALAGRLRGLLADVHMRGALGSWAASRWRQFEWRAVAGQVEAVYRQAIA